MRILFRLAALLFAAAILFASLQPFSGTPSLTHFDKLQHFLAYGVLTVLLGMGWPRLRVIWLIAGATLFGAGVEVAQGLSGTGRVPSVLDGLANLVGALMGGALIHVRYRD